MAVTRKNAHDDVDVFIGTPSGAAPPAGVDADEWVDVPLAGLISGDSKRGVRYFLADPGRFPTYGGHAVQKDTQIAVVLRSRDASGTVIKARWGPVTVAGGAIIDLNMKL